jgi:hypothetical protein
VPERCFWGQKFSPHASHWFVVKEPDYFKSQIEWFLNNA